MNEKNFTKKAIDVDKKYFKLKYVLTVGIIVGVLFAVLAIFFPSIDIFVESAKKFFLYLIIPIFQLFLILYCTYFLLKGGYTTVITKDVQEIGKERVKHALKQMWLFSILVPGSGQLLLGHTKRGIILFVMALLLEVALLILIANIARMFIATMVLLIVLIVFWIWNVRDASTFSKNLSLN